MAGFSLTIDAGGKVGGKRLTEIPSDDISMHKNKFMTIEYQLELMMAVRDVFELSKRISQSA